jgi:Trk-type K+ transport system membrane component
MASASQSDEVDLFASRCAAKVRKATLRMNYFRCVLLYLVFISLIGGGIICGCSPDVGYIDGLFLAVSACTGTGLGTVEMNVLSTGSFVVIFILMFLGGTVVLLVPPMVYRRAVFSKLQPKLREFVEKEGRTDRPSVNALVAVLRKRELLHRAVGMMMIAILFYLFLWLFCGAFIMYGCILRYPHPPELVSRGFTQLWTAFFLTASCFFNCGYTLTSDRQGAHSAPKSWHPQFARHPYAAHGMDFSRPSIHHPH